jgi:hypothetical protein
MVGESLHVAKQNVFLAPAHNTAPIEAAIPVQIVATSGLMYCIVINLILHKHPGEFK